PITRVRPVVGKNCKKCEYRLPAGSPGKSGFRECWGPLADADPHILDLYRIDLVGGSKNDTAGALATEGKSRLVQVPKDLLLGSNGSLHEIQLETTPKGQEFIHRNLPRVLSSHPYPLHFIDFEGSRLALPYHAGMRPYEQASFQWSCHTICVPGGPVEHAGWL